MDVSSSNRQTRDENLPHGSAQFFIGHFGILFAFAPHFGHFVRLDKLEHSILSSFPSDEAGICSFVQ